MARLKEGYLIWVNILPHIPKSSRYTIGTRIENKFLDLLELSYTAYFSSSARKSSSAYFIEKEQKSAKIAGCIFTLDILKFLISIAWETKLISHKQYEDIALKLDEVGKMFWGWKKSMDQPDKQSLKAEAYKKKNPA